MESIDNITVGKKDIRPPDRLRPHCKASVTIKLQQLQMGERLTKAMDAAFWQSGLTHEIRKFEPITALRNTIENLRRPHHSWNQLQGTFFITYSFIHMPSLPNRQMN